MSNTVVDLRDSWSGEHKPHRLLEKEILLEAAEKFSSRLDKSDIVGSCKLKVSYYWSENCSDEVDGIHCLIYPPKDIFASAFIKFTSYLGRVKMVYRPSGVYQSVRFSFSKGEEEYSVEEILTNIRGTFSR